MSRMWSKDVFIARMTVCNPKVVIVVFPYRISNSKKDLYVRPIDGSSVYKAPRPDIFCWNVAFPEFKGLMKGESPICVDDMTIRGREIQFTLATDLTEEGKRTLATAIKTAFGLGVAEARWQKEKDMPARITGWVQII